MRVEQLYIIHNFSGPDYFKDPRCNIKHHPTEPASVWPKYRRFRWAIDGLYHNTRICTSNCFDKKEWILQDYGILEA